MENTAKQMRKNLNCDILNMGKSLDRQNGVSQ